MFAGVAMAWWQLAWTNAAVIRAGRRSRPSKAAGTTLPGSRPPDGIQGIPQIASASIVLPSPACAVVVKLFIETDAGDQLAAAQDQQCHARPPGAERRLRGGRGGRGRTAC